MTSANIKETISNCFSEFPTKGFQFMKSNRDNSLSIMDEQELNGDETAALAGEGSLYLTQVQTKQLQLALQVLLCILNI